MITIRQGSRVYELLTFLSIVGEYPICSLSLLGSKDAWRKYVQKLSRQQEYRFPDSSEPMRCQLLTISGKDKLRTIRISKTAHPILERMNPAGYHFYIDTYARYRPPGNEERIDRAHRVAEAVAMVQWAGINISPFLLPKLQTTRIASVVPSTPSFYLGKELKGVGDDADNKTMFSRIAGALFYPGGCYAVYNSRDYLMRWNGKGESKTRLNLAEIARMNAHVSDVPAAILFGANFDIAHLTLQSLDKIKRPELRFDTIYERIHFIPMDQFGAHLLQVLTVPDWNEQLLELLFDPEDRSYNRGVFEYDALENGVYVFSFLDGDIIRLYRFREAIVARPDPVEVICFPEQMRFLQEYIGSRARIRTVDMKSVQEAMITERREPP